ncbi:molecular chaperone DjlA [Marinobacter caseinilyticus]|uniref:molecular chaperone DjlA n=1 Tax=Marinobacter caseinilyticus TaxID=2692195 RepID=UPI0014093FF5|nr:molecular chaperone DjlA [Marinobacter caseinilyticus]
MTPLPSDGVLTARTETEFYALLDKLNACNHQAHHLVARGRLPRWCLRSLFYFLGYVAKAEGRVTPADIEFAESLIKSLHLSKRQRRKAIEQFQQGKQASALSFWRALRLRITHRWWPAPALQIVFCLCHASQLLGQPGKPRRYRCEDAIDHMGLPTHILEEVLNSYARKVWIARPELQPLPDTYEQACKLLGVSTREAFEKMKQAYRRRVSECHPDKLDRTLGETELALAKERLLRYQTAWELIKRRHTGR